jgi:hypothetical protein
MSLDQEVNAKFHDTDIDTGRRRGTMDIIPRWCKMSRWPETAVVALVGRLVSGETGLVGSWRSSRARGLGGAGSDSAADTATG